MPEGLAFADENLEGAIQARYLRNVSAVTGPMLRDCRVKGAEDSDREMVTATEGRYARAHRSDRCRHVISSARKGGSRTSSSAVSMVVE